MSLPNSLSNPRDLQPALAPLLDALAEWRMTMAGQMIVLESFLRDADLLTPDAANQCAGLRQRLATDRLVIAFVAEFARGKSELINAIFFADAGQRVLPATPGRTTKCPVELCWDERDPPRLALLPIDTRLRPETLADWRDMPEAWTTVELDTSDTNALVKSLSQVTATRYVSREQAHSLGLWSEDHPEDNPPSTADGRVEVPAWRHAIINYPHPLLKRGLVVVDTPGLNAIGTEPELTLSLLPSAHAVLFILGADTGVTRTDLAVWNQHLNDPSLARYVVLNKIDTLADPLATSSERQDLIERQCLSAADTLGVPRHRVFPVSARQALSARLQNDSFGLVGSKVPLLENALRDELLPQRQRLLTTAVISQVQSLQEQISRRLRELRRQNAEQMLELRALRGKSSGRIGMMLARVHSDTEEFNRCAARLTALKSVQQRMVRGALAHLDVSHVRAAAERLQHALGGGWFNLRAKPLFADVCRTLVEQIDRAAHDSVESQHMLTASFRQLNAEFGFTLEVAAPPDYAPLREELGRIEQGYARYFGVGGRMRMNSQAFAEQFQRMLVSKLRIVFDQASSQLDAWNEAITAQLDGQFRDRRQSFRRRKENLERIQEATGELETRLADVERVDQQLLEHADRAFVLTAALRLRAQQGPNPVAEAAATPTALTAAPVAAPESQKGGLPARIQMNIGEQDEASSQVDLYLPDLQLNFRTDQLDAALAPPPVSKPLGLVHSDGVRPSLDPDLE